MPGLIQGEMNPMKPLLAATLLATAPLAAASAAHATLICDAPVQFSGKTGTNPVISSVVWHDGPTWNVVHTLRDGTRIDRSTQYNMVDATPTGHLGWHGWSTKNPHLWMGGEVFVIDASRATYDEWLHDNTNGGDVVVMHSETACHTSTPRPEPTVVASAPAPTYTSPVSMRLPITFGNSGAYIAVSIGTTAATMLVDTGATGMTVSESIANQLIASGQATSAPAETVGLAGGVKQEFRQVNISSVTVGGHVVTNVHARVVPDGADMLLGLGVLAKVSGKFAINVANSTLDFD
jgi:hypothetical protein